MRKFCANVSHTQMRIFGANVSVYEKIMREEYSVQTYVCSVREYSVQTYVCMRMLCACERISCAKVCEYTFGIESRYAPVVQDVELVTSRIGSPVPL